VPAEADDATLRMIWLAGVFMAMTFATFALYGAFAGAVRERILARPAAMRWIRLTFAGSFTLLGLRLALAER
jgi:threonine/homoserine/homoserine lactone efflux protein